MLRKVLVTGASGFVGSRVVEYLLLDQRFDVQAALRNLQAHVPEGATAVRIAPLEGDHCDMDLQGVDTVVHCAARVHVMNEQSADPLAAFRKVNVEGTLALARQAAADGVRRFIFISSIKVNGEGTDGRQPYSADEAPLPQDPYGISKLEAEQALHALAAQTTMEVVVIRPVLVYGPGVKANFQSMMKWLHKGVPLPLGGIRNQRSMVALDNLVDLIRVCIDHPSAAGEVFLASDGEDLSTPDLLRRTARALQVKARLLPVPASWLTTAARIIGRPAMAARLCGSLQVDIGKTRRLLDWTPPVSVDQALGTTARHYLDLERSNA
ncbi:SDR family oxidoreductase [Pseudomonas sp. RW10S2]|uniref:UDP-glucose 4-epimerase family protein n=1 Tax=Pseudomonas sp. RW10S2 TaxID=459637 RepID=UPI0016480DE7|nr:SDR family oxidoreductase [Pseudomonas sp. RW10S2]MBC3465580.1 SDR family oxidoreductase [Pseudomonas sp. RW10S2]QXI44660.1 SDR family oxidoreductase [Pseudomonas wayambapalatensis]